jgi:AraC-like DNA-binding protein
LIGFVIRTNYKKNGGWNYSTNPIYKWLIFFIGIFVFVWITEFNAFILLMVNRMTPFFCQYTASVYVLIPFILFNFILYIALRNPKLFILRKNSNGHNLSISEIKMVLDKLMTLLIHEKIYTNPDISLDSVSVMLNIHSKCLSKLINENLNQSFYELIIVNRINESRRLLIECPDKNIQEIMFDIGFSSKSSFNTSFKKATGLTPKEFRLQNI